MRAGQVIVADRWFASSKTCSVCGHKLDELSLSVRQWSCPECGATRAPDVNAAINLKNLDREFHGVRLRRALAWIARPR